MRLPDDNTLRLTDDDPFVIDNADASALTDDDVLRLLPAWVRAVNTRLRRALVAQARAFWTYVHNRTGIALAALKSPRNASGLTLTAHGVRRHRPRAVGEAEAAYRERLLSHPAVVSPAAITDAVRALVRAERAVDPVVIEPATDGMFAGTMDAPWACFAQVAGRGPLWGDFPDDPRPGVGVWVSSVYVMSSPSFVVLLEGGINEGADDAFTMPHGTDDDLLTFAHVAPDAWSFVPYGAPSLERRVLMDVESRRAGGVVWLLWIEPTLGGAL